MTDAGTHNTKPEAENHLTGHLGITGATALAITVCVGGGALVLPGVAYAAVGTAALYAWLAATVLTVPLLLVFSHLGGRYPGAGGVAGFVRAAFGERLAAGVEILALGTFGLGIPGIALTGGTYAAVLPGFSGLGTEKCAAFLVVLAGAVVYAGVQLSSRVQVALALILTVSLVALGIYASFGGPDPLRLPDARFSDIAAGVGASGLVFFAFTGWEMIAFTTEEYRNPRRDFPRVVIISFVIVTVMYFLLALSVQSQLDRGDPTQVAAPVQALAAVTISPRAGHTVAALGMVIIVANLIGAIWGASRLVMSSGREGLLPRWISHLGPSRQPRRSVVACCLLFLLVITASSLGWLPLATLLTIAGKNFYVMYLLCAFAYVRLTKGWKRSFGVCTVTVFLAIAVASFGATQLVYSLTLIASGVLVTLFRKN